MVARNARTPIVCAGFSLGAAVLLGLFCVVPILLVGSSPSAAFELALSDEELVYKAETIIRGRVTQTRSEWNADQTQIHTFVDIDVDATLKGRLPEDKLQLRVLGGTVDDVRMKLFHVASYVPGEEVVLFLGPNRYSYFPLVGAEQGKFNVVTDENGQRLVGDGFRVLEPEAQFLNRINTLVQIEASRTDAEVPVRDDLPRVQRP